MIRGHTPSKPIFSKRQMALPRLSLNALRAFEATARLQSFSAAADELSVTHGAVSRHIRMLEDSLGLPLLNRSARMAQSRLKKAGASPKDCHGPSI